MTKKFLMSLSIGLIACIGDWIEENGNKGIVFRALVDSLTHSLVGLMAWRVICHNSHTWIVEILLCALLSAIIDIDHFISAKSLSLKDAVSLNHRPFLHCTSIPVFLLVVSIAISNYFRSVLVNKLSWILLVAFLTHHVRDSYRRGLWVWPFGSTPPIPYWLYISFEVTFPYIVIYLQSLSKWRHMKLVESQIL